MSVDARYRFTAQDKSKGAVRSFRKNILRADKAVGGLKTHLAGLASAAAMGALVKTATDAGDRVQKLSIQLGVSTEDLSQYRHAAQIAGSNLETLTKGIRQMERQVSDASRGLGEGRDALKLLGLEATSLMQLDPKSMFLEIADAISQVKSPADRMGASMDLLGRAGGDLLPLLEGGAKGVNELAREADQLGLTLNRLEADQLAATNDALTRVKSSGVSFGQSLALLASGPIQSVADGLVDLVGGFRDWVDQLGEDAIDRALRSMKELGQEVEHISQLTAIRDLRDTTEALNAESGGLVDTLEKLHEKTERYTHGVRQVGTVMTDGTNAAARYGNSFNDLAAEMNQTMNVVNRRAIQALEAETQAMKDADEAADRLRGTFNAVGIDVDDITSGLRELSNTQNPFDTANLETASGLLKEIEGAQAAINVGLLKGELGGDAWDTATEKLTGYWEVLQKYKQQLEVLMELEARRNELVNGGQGGAPGTSSEGEWQGPLLQGPGGEVNAAVDTAMQKTGELVEGMESPSARFDLLVTAMGSTREEAELLADAFGTLGSFGEEAMGQFLNASIAAVSGSKKAYGEMGKVLLKWAADSLKALASQAAGKALFYAAEGLAWTSLGQGDKAGAAFAAAKMYGVMAAYGGAAAIAVGAASSNNAPSGSFMSQTEREGATGLADGGSSSSSGVSSSMAQAQMPTTMHITHVYYGPVSFGSQDAATAAGIQAEIDTGALDLEGGAA